MRNHYVPQFLLAGWAENSSDGMFQEFHIDLAGVPTYRRVPKATGYQVDLYALSREQVGKMTQHAIETQLLRHIDNDAARVRAKLLDQGLRSLSFTERCDWVRFLMSLRLRQPQLFSYLRNESATHLRKTLHEQPEEYEALAQEGDDAPTLVEWVEENHPGLIENFGLSFFHTLVDNEEIGDKLYKLHWWLCDFSDARHDLLLSDNPCIFTGGIDEPELIVALPLAPRRAFFATRGNRTADRLRAADASDVAVQLNVSSVYQARARIYARNRTPMRFITNQLRAGQATA